MSIIDRAEYLDDLFIYQKQKNMRVNSESKLSKYFSEWNEAEIVNFLYAQGMLQVCSESKKLFEEWEKANPSQGLKEMYEELRESFNGPAVDIFTFPIDIQKPELMEEMKGKNGISFKDMILLFFSCDVPIPARQALLTHEYHHCSWLKCNMKSEDSVTLIDSIVMEGLAEWEVGRRFGSEFIAPWFKRYDDDLLISWWNRLIKNKRLIIGRENHLTYLYGGLYGLPKWLGYNIGYRMVESFTEQLKSVSSKELLKITSEEIYQNSLFSGLP